MRDIAGLLSKVGGVGRSITRSYNNSILPILRLCLLTDLKHQSRKKSSAKIDQVKGVGDGAKWREKKKKKGRGN